MRAERIEFGSQGWQPFDHKYGASFHVSPTLLPITGKFEW
jgi:hypothetical protein